MMMIECDPGTCIEIATLQRQAIRETVPFVAAFGIALVHYRFLKDTLGADHD